jgi:hypothetical protein
MKKLLIVLLALTVMGVFAFAQDAAPALQFSDSFSTGVLYQNPSTGSDSVKMFDYWDNGYALYNDLDLSYKIGNFTWFAEFDTTNANLAGQPTFDALSLKGKFFNDMLAVEVGRTSNGNFTTLGDSGTNNWWIKGAIVTLAPIPGLTLGFGMPGIDTAVTSTNALQGSQIGLAYTMDKVFTVKAEYDAMGVSNGATFWGSFSLAAIENLKVTAEVKMAKIGNTAADTAAVAAAGPYTLTAATGVITPATAAVAATTGGVTTANETVGYTMGALNPGAVVYETLYAASGSGTGLKFKPFVNYTIDKTTLSADFVYEIAAVSGVSATTNNWTIQAAVKQAWEKATGWVGLEYGNVGATSLNTFKLFLSTAIAF